MKIQSFSSLISREMGESDEDYIPFDASLYPAWNTSISKLLLPIIITSIQVYKNTITWISNYLFVGMLSNTSKIIILNWGSCFNFWNFQKIYSFCIDYCIYKILSRYIESIDYDKLSMNCYQCKFSGDFTVNNMR